MTLATRCPSCGTVFRVVQDQLRVSEGWVRCGRCNGVFDAAEVLFDIDTGAPVSLGLPAGPEPAPGPSAAPPVPASAEVMSAPPDPAPSWPAEAPFDPPPEAQPDSDRLDPRFDAQPTWAASGPVEPGFADNGLAAVPLPSQREEPLLRAPSRAAEDDAEPIVVTDHVQRATPAPPSAVVAGVVEPAAPANVPVPVAPTAMVQGPPSFLRVAERAALWRRPAVRAGLWAGVVLLGAAALAQGALLWRDPLAAHVPATLPALQAMCRLAGCSVQPLRRIDALSVDSSGLNRLEGSTLYRLQLVLRNRADTPVMAPALDLSLTDGQGQLVSRRVIQLAELGVPQAALQAGQDLSIKALLATGDRRVDGYTLELFYP